MSVPRRAGSGVVRVGRGPFLAGGRKRCTNYQTRAWFVLLAMAGFFVSFLFLVYVVFCFIVVGCQYKCSRLPLSEMTCYMSSGTLNPTHSLTQSFVLCLLNGVVLLGAFSLFWTKPSCCLAARLLRLTTSLGKVQERAKDD